ncbi:hypothetical protein [Caldinitratiruptor microaerophilus]|uniref:Uncharacterized protein n=1 Tax=Caldinitratiruptor microaerophilus TaxID=671077 RepID=A0AA35G8N1_9FIRM|nr:hypothetical protein [Caldinitratiruptor microaerophilus]BDG59434.1 hypothetical protein caldi_05240 [Caldinitratiruptor microaerophilus]
MGRTRLVIYSMPVPPRRAPEPRSEPPATPPAPLPDNARAGKAGTARPQVVSTPLGSTHPTPLPTASLHAPGQPSIPISATIAQPATAPTPPSPAGPSPAAAEPPVAGDMVPEGTTETEDGEADASEPTGESGIGPGPEAEPAPAPPAAESRVPSLPPLPPMPSPAPLARMSRLLATLNLPPAAREVLRDLGSLNPASAQDWDRLMERTLELLAQRLAPPPKPDPDPATPPVRPGKRVRLKRMRVRRVLVYRVPEDTRA